MKKILLTLLLIIFTSSLLLYSQTNVTITNVSINPNPFSPNADGQRDEAYINYYLYYPTTITNPSVQLTIYRNNNQNDVVKTATVTPINGLNQYVWDGRNNSGVVVPDGNYGLKIRFVNPETIFIFDNGIIVKTTYPEIEMISASPNPFSPNDDGYQDVQTIRYNVKNADVYYLGTIRVNFEDSTAYYVADDLETMTTPNPIPHSDGVYLFLSRPSQLYSQITIPSNMSYRMTVGGFQTTVTSGYSLYKLGENYIRSYGNIGASVGVEPAEYYGARTDFIVVYAISGNMSFNSFYNDGSPLNLNDLYPYYFGSFVDNPSNRKVIDSSIGAGYVVNLGKNEGQIPGTELEDDRYIYRIIVSNEVETGVYSSGEFIVNNDPINIAGAVNPNKISPQKVDGVFDQTVIQYTPTEDAFVTVKIWNSSNQIVKTIIQNQLNRKGIGNYVLWDGKDSNGNVVSLNNESVYRIEITATDRYINDEVASLNLDILVDNKSPITATLYQSQPDSLNAPSIIVSGLTDEINSEIILFQNGVEKGVVGTTPAYPGYFQFPVSLEEGVNNISIKLRDSVYNVGPQSNSLYYYLDSQAPVISNLTPESNSVFTTLPITFSAQVTDNGVGVNQVRFGFSLNNNENLIWKNGVRVGTTDTYTCSLDNTVIGDNISQVSIAMTVTAIDRLNNSTTTSNPMSYTYFRPSATIPPVLTSSYPTNNSAINILNNNQLNIQVLSENPLQLNPASTYLKLYSLVNGDTLSHGFGANLTYSAQSNTYTISLNLTNPLYENGAVDAQYRLYYQVKNQVNQVITGNIYFDYDTLVPEITQFKINNSTIPTAGNRSYYTSTINTISMMLSDNLSDIDLAMNMTNIILKDEQGNVIAGERSYSAHQVNWVLNQPLTLTSPANYVISALVTDQAGNSKTEEKVFTLLTPQTPVITTPIYPVNNQILNNLQNNKISKTIIDVNGFGLDPINSSIILSKGSSSFYHNHNAVQSIVQNSDGSYELSLSLSEPLPADGSADGVYTVTTNVRDLLNQAVNNQQMTFTYDSQTPVFDNPMIGKNGTNSWNQSLVNNSVYNQTMNYVQIKVDDLTSNVNVSATNTFIKLYNSNNQLIPGALTYDSVNKILQWTLNNPRPQNADENGNYYVIYKAVDYAGNLIEGRIDFSLMDNTHEPVPVIYSSYPLNNQNLNLINSNQVSVTVQSAYPIQTNILNSYITLTHIESGNVIQHANGANLSFLVNGDKTTLTLNLLRALYTDGADDGHYRIDWVVKSSIDQVQTGSVNFIYDTVKPNILSFNIDNSLLSQSNIRYYYTSNFNAVSVDLNDNAPSAGIDYSPNLTKISLKDETGNVITGQLQLLPNQNKIVWNLNSPAIVGTTPKNYQITVSVTDLAGNVYTENRTFTLLNPVNPEIISYLPVQNSKINLLSNNEVIVNISDDNGFGLNQQLTNITLSNQSYSYIPGVNAVKTLTQNTDGTYNLVLRLLEPLSADNSADGTYNVNVTIVDNLNQQRQSQISFIYDTKAPTFTNAKIGSNLANNTWEENLYNNKTLNQMMNYIKVQVTDETAGLNTLAEYTNLKMFNAQRTLMPGQLTLVSGVLTWTLNEAMPQNLLQNGAYYLTANAMDFAGNQSTLRIDFNLQDTSFEPLPILISAYPDFNQNINNIVQNQIKVKFESTYPINLSHSQTFVKLVHIPSGNIIQNGLGAVLSSQIQNNETTLILTLNRALYTDGSDDADYRVDWSVRTSIGQIQTGSVPFKYDTLQPVISAYLINNDPLNVAGSRYYYTNTIRSVSMQLTDNLSGILYAPNLTKITLKDQQGNIVFGYPNSDNTTWVLSDSIVVNDNTLPMNFVLSAIVTDNAGNLRSENRTFTLLRPKTPAVNSHLPVNNAVINQLSNNMIVKNITDTNGFGLNTNETRLSLVQGNTTYTHGQNAVQTITQNQDGTYDLKLTLNNPLANDASNDGTFMVNTVIKDLLNQSVNNQSSFVFDTQAPAFSNAKISGNTQSGQWNLDLSSDITILNSVNRVKIKATDIISNVNFSSTQTFIKLYKSDNQLVPGSIINNPADSTLSWVLTQPYPQNTSDNGAYYVRFSAQDNAGNTSLGTINFNIYNPDTIPMIVQQTYPANGQNLNQIVGNQVRIVVNSQFPINTQESSLRLTHTQSGQSIYNNYGAVLSYSTQNNLTTMTLTLNQALMNDGSADAQYNLVYSVKNSINQIITGSIPFIYDTTKPNTPTLSQILLDENILTVINNTNYIINSFAQVSATLSDNLSGINFASNLTRIGLYSSDDVIIPGYSPIPDTINKRIFWNLTTPVTSDIVANYKIKLLMTDRAGNQKEIEIPFTKLNPSNPQFAQNQAHYPSDNQHIKQLTANQVYKRVIDTNGFGFDRTNSSIVLKGPLVNYAHNDGAVKSFTNIQNNLYQFNLTLNNSLPTDGTADGAYRVITTIVDTLSMSVSDSLNFIYDTQSPLVSSQTIGGLEWQNTLTQNASYSSEVTFIQLAFTDVNPINYSTQNTFIGLYNAQNTLLTGTQIIPNPYSLKYQLNSPILTDSTMVGFYYVLYSVSDLAGNIKNGRIDFQVVNPLAPNITSIYPQNGIITNLITNNRIEVNFTDTRPINISDFTNNYIRLTLPDNSTIQHNSGATQAITSLGNNNYKITLTLNQALTQLGDYNIQVKVSNNQESTVMNSQFSFDNQAPFYQFIKIGLTNGTEYTLNVNNNIVDQIYNSVAYVKAFYADQHSGVDYQSSDTYIIPYINNQLIPGNLEKVPSENYVKYTFNNSVAGASIIIALQISIKDQASNIYSAQKSFNIDAIQTTIVSVEPTNNSFVNTNLNQIKFTFDLPQEALFNYDISTLRLQHPDSSYIDNGNGASLQITSNNNRYEMTLNLNQPLSELGQDDGLFKIYSDIVTNNFTESPTFIFTYDRLTPYYRNLKVNNLMLSENTRENPDLSNTLKNERSIIDEAINYIQVDFGDYTSNVNFVSNQTVISLFSPTGQLIPGVRQVQGNTVKWILNNTIPANGTKDGVYTILMKATDFAGNIFNQNYQFVLMSNIPPVLTEYTPENVINHYTHEFNPPQITMTFDNSIPIIQDVSKTYIHLLFPTGTIVDHINGALDYEVNDDDFKIVFQLLGPLSTNGENDGLYRIIVRAENISGGVFYLDHPDFGFIYDTILPTYSNLAILRDGITSSLSANSIVTQNFSQVQVRYSDLTSGLNYTDNMSYISVYDRNNNIIPGLLSSPVGDTLTYTFTNPNAIPFDGSADGVYKVKMLLTDQAGNSITHEVPFNVLSVIAPQNFTAFLDAVYKVQLNWSMESFTKKQEKSRSINRYMIYRKYANQDYTLIAQTQNMYYSDNLQQLPDGQYKYMIKAVYTVAGNTQELVSDGVTSSNIEVNRFVPVTINITLADGQSPTGVQFDMIGNDGLYNQQYHFTTSNTGIISLPNVFMTEYLLTLSKQGYQTKVDTILVNAQNNQFTFTLGPDGTFSMLKPTKYELYQNFPNPFNPTTEIRYALKEASKVELSIYNIKGQKVKQLLDADKNYGYHKVVWNGDDQYGSKVSSGIYFYVISVKNDKESYREIKKMMMMK